MKRKVLFIMKLNDEIVQELITIRGVSTLPLCRLAERCEITYQTLRNWLKNGERHKQKLEDGEIRKGDLSVKEKRELTLFVGMGKAQTVKEENWLAQLEAMALEKKCPRTLQWLLKIQHKAYRETSIEDEQVINKGAEIVVVNLSNHDGQAPVLLTEFFKGTGGDGEEEAGNKEDTNDRIYQ